MMGLESSAERKPQNVSSRLLRIIRRVLRVSFASRIVPLSILIVLLALVGWFAVIVRLGKGLHGANSLGLSARAQAELARTLWRDVVEGVGLRGSTVASSRKNDIAWEDIMHDVAVIIKTGHEVSSTRLKYLREIGWMSLGRRVPNLLVVSDTNGPGVVGMREYGKELIFAADAAAAAIEGFANQTSADQNGIDNQNSRTTVRSRGKPKKWFSSKGWRGDKDKNLPAFHLARSLYPGKKWYIMLDDDTYIFLDNFARFTLDHSEPEEVATPFYTGKIFLIANCAQWGRHGENLVQKKGPTAAFAHGGSGIVLNGAAMDAIYTSIPECIHSFSSCWAGDIQTALCLRRVGISPRKYGTYYERHFTPFHPSHALGDARYIKRWRSTERPITFHKVPLEQLKLLSRFERKCVEEHVPVVYANLLEFLLENNVRPTFPKKKSPHETHIFDKRDHRHKSS